MSSELFAAREALPLESIPQRFEAFVWFLRRRPAAPLIFSAALAVCIPVIVLVGAPLEAPADWLVAVSLAIAWVAAVWLGVMAALCAVYFVIAAMPAVTRWATEDARIGIWERRGRKPGWYAAEHVARPGVAGAGREIRLLLNRELREVADEDGIHLYASTHSEKLAARYCEDIEGLRVVNRTWWGRIDLERPPRGEWPTDAG